jgi:putative acetyltransferase
LLIRDEKPSDQHQVRKVNEAAFERADEADLIDRLRAEGAILLSLVAEADGQVIGHILFSRMSIQTERGIVPAAALAPLAVLPSHQRQHIGSRLVRDGLSALRDRGEAIVIVLGHKSYYPRFGFTAEKARYLASPFPAESFMALELVDAALANVRGSVEYPAAFGL